MCGIAGLINYNEPKRILPNMLERIQHRGPDAMGKWYNKNIALGHTRLSIIDLSTNANQPMIKDGLVIVYNGEVYNFLQLKSELKKDGIQFKTTSDTEVVLELFRKYKEKSFNKLRGMFAFAIYNISKKEMFIVRDHFGIKPLYFYRRNDKLVFSSELKAFLDVPDFKKEINMKSLISSVNYYWIYGNESIYKNVYKLPPAHYMKINLNNNNISIKKFWELKYTFNNYKEKDYIEGLADVLEKSIKLHLISDVPVGAFLSGGLDSSIITAIAKKYNPDISSYTMSLNKKDMKVEKMPDDNLYASMLAKKLNLNHHDIPLKPDILNLLDKIVYFLDEPIGDPAAINTYLISKLARDNGIKVLLSGMGADEIFGGYRRQMATLLTFKYQKLPLPLRKLMRNTINRFPVQMGNHGIKSIRWLKRFLSFAELPVDSAYMRSYSLYNKDELYKLFKNQYNNIIDEMYEEHNEIFNRIKKYNVINKMCYTDIFMFMNGLNLTYTDRASMAASVEVRVPFIDKEVVEFAMSIPGSLKIKRNQQKYILKKAAENYLPKKIIYRPKASFGMPIRSWISNDLKNIVDEYLSKENINKRGIFNYKFLKEIIENEKKGLEDNAHKIYQFLTIEIWFRRFING